jgi:hypothetical protein
MRKRFLVILTVLFVFGLAAMAFAFNRATNNNAPQTSAATCPMHKQMATTSGEHKDSCCGMADCCKDGKCQMGGACCKDKDSCPMKKTGDAKTDGEMNMSKVTVVGGEKGADCCKPGADCCKGGACCHKKS